MRHRFLATFAMFVLSACALSAQEGSRLPSATLDLTAHDWDLAPIVDLKAMWRWAWQKSIEPDSPELDTLPTIEIPHPSWGIPTDDGSIRQLVGTATFALDVRLAPEFVGSTVEFWIPEIASASRVYVDGELVSRVGSPDDWEMRPVVASYFVRGPTMRIVVQVWNPQIGVGGLSHPIRLSAVRAIGGEIEIQNHLVFLLVGIFASIFIFYFATYIFNAREKIVLIFSIFCLTMMLTFVAQQSYTLFSLFPQMSLEAFKKFQYLSFYGSNFFGVYFILSAFPSAAPQNRVFRAIALGLLAFCALFVLFTPFSVYSYFVRSFDLVAGLYAPLVLYVLFRAVAQKFEGIWIIVIGEALLIFATTFDKINEFFPFSSATMRTYGTIALVISQGLFLLLRYSKAFQRSEATKENLEHLVALRTEKLEEANRQLRGLDTLKNEFIANVTHDFRSPLMVILNHSDLGMKYDSKAEIDAIRNRYQVIHDASYRLKNSIDRLLEIAKMDSSEIQLRVRKISIKSLLKNMFDFYQSAVMYSTIHLQCELPANEIDNFYSDPDKLDEILANLLSNALKFVPLHEGRIVIELHDLSDRLRIVVRDNGVGIPPSELERIFERFQQLEPGRDSKFQGTGIGLAFSRQLAELLHARLWAESEGEGRGASFILECPLGRDAFGEKDFVSDVALEANEVSKPSEKIAVLKDVLASKTTMERYETDLSENSTDPFVDPKSSTILVVDDNASIRQILHSYLKTAGYRNFILAENGAQALEAIYSYKPQLIVSDYNMPEMRGDELQDTIAQNPDLKKIPFIFLTAVSNPALEIERRQKGSAAFLTKPIDEATFLMNVNFHISQYLEYRKVLRIAQTDELTGLHNRRYFMTQLQNALSLRTYRPISMLFMDIDHFKSFNDTYGHPVGDAVLAAVGTSIRDSVRQYDVAARYGGEEFAVLLPETTLEQARSVAEKLLNAIRSVHVESGGQSLSITVSIGAFSIVEGESLLTARLGLSSIPALFEAPQTLLADLTTLDAWKEKLASALIEFSDQALYDAKSSSCRNCGHRTLKDQDFAGGTCPKCGGNDVEFGRNRIRSIP